MKDFPNIVFVFADQWRRHAVGCMHADPVLTPRMDGFAREGLLHENAFCCSPICTPSRASILSGRYPQRLDMMHNWLQFPAEVPGIAPILNNAGYETGYIGKWHLDAFQEGDRENAWNIYTPPGPRRLGFRHWYAHGCNHNHFTLKYMNTAGEVYEGKGWQVDHETDHAIRYLRNEGGAMRAAEKPFCLFLSWSPPHTIGAEKPLPPTVSGWHFGAPERFEALYRRPELPARGNARADYFREAAPGYFGAVTSMDENFGRLLDALEEFGLIGETIVVLTSDHGEMLGSHGQMTKDVWFEESVGIPFIIRWPGHIPAGRRSSALFSTIDMLPSLLGLAGVAYDKGVDGADFSGHWRGGEAPEREHLFLAHNCGSPYEKPGIAPDYPEEPGRYWRAVRAPRHLYVAVECSPESQYHDVRRFRRPFPAGVHEALYDLDNDPAQLHPIYPGQRGDEPIPVFRETLRGWLRSIGDTFWEERVEPHGNFHENGARGVRGLRGP